MQFFRSSLFVAACFLSGGTSAAHDIPSDITVQIFAKPAGERLTVLVRLPLKAVRDLDFPERAGGYLDLEKLAPLLGDAAKVWIIDYLEIQEDASRLSNPRLGGTQVSLESDRSFESFESALAHVTGPRLTNSSNVVWNQVMFDVLLEYRIRSDRSRYSIRPEFEGFAGRVITVVRYLAPGGAVRAYEFSGNPGVVPLDPRWQQASLRFVRLGFSHILDGKDHLLFLLCLVIPLRRFRPLAGLITAFTVAHCFTLLASAYGIVPDGLWFPPLIEMLIAVSIVYMALENIAGADQRRRWIVVFCFGLVHGFGFSFALRDALQFSGSHLLISLLSFNAGIELGQALVLVLLVPALAALFHFVAAERMGTIIVSALVAHTGWHWMVERWETLSRFSLPNVDAALLAGAARWLAMVLILGAAAGIFVRALRIRSGRDPQPDGGERIGVQID